MLTPTLTPRHCPNCDSHIVADFCAQCGQSQEDPRRSIVGWIREVGDEFSINGRLLRSLWLLVSRPGFLTTEWIAGRRARYLSPFKLYAIGLVVLVTTIYLELNEGHFYDLHHVPIWWLPPQFAASVKALIHDQLRSAILIMTFGIVPVLILTLKLTAERTSYLVDHVVFALHFSTFMMLTTAVAIALVGAHESYVFVHDDPSHIRFELIILLVSVIVIGGYVIRALLTTYGWRSGFGLARMVLVPLAVYAVPAALFGPVWNRALATVNQAAAPLRVFDPHPFGARMYADDFWKAVSLEARGDSVGAAQARARQIDALLEIPSSNQEIFQAAHLLMLDGEPHHALRVAMANPNSGDDQLLVFGARMEAASSSGNLTLAKASALRFLAEYSSISPSNPVIRTYAPLLARMHETAQKLREPSR